MKNKLASLIEVRKIIALTGVVLFFVLSIMKILEPTFIQTTLIMIFSYYFSKSTALDKPKE